MLRNLRKIPAITSPFPSAYNQRQTFLTNDYKCTEAWNSQTSTPILNKVNLNDFYNVLDQNFLSKGVISALDVDIFANSTNEPVYLEELKDLLHKLRLSAETGSMLESTHHATVRNYIEFDQIEELVDMLQDPLNFGLFLDDFTANILLDKLIVSEKYEWAAKVASTVMLQENFNNDITCALCQYACYKYISTPRAAPEPVAPAPSGKPNKVEEIKIRVKFLRNPYFDDHFDIKDTLLLAGKTLAWISERSNDNINNNLQILGYLMYKKHDKLLALCEDFAKCPSSKLHIEVIDQIKIESNVEDVAKELLDKCISVLGKVQPSEIPLEKSLKITIENAINKVQNNDMSKQKQLFKSWAQVREEKLEEQTKRLDRAKRMQLIQEKQKELNEQEQKLWFFENEDAIDLQIEEKEQLVEKPTGKKSTSNKADEDYIPPEIVPQRK